LRDRRAIDQNRLATEDGQRAFEGQTDELAAYTFVFDAAQGLGSQEVVLLPVNQELQPGLERVVVGRDVDSPGKVRFSIRGLSIAR